MTTPTLPRTGPATQEPRRRSTGPPGTPPSASSSQQPTTHAVTTLFGALSVIGGATALMPLIDGASWLLPIVEIVAVVWVVGVGARLLAVPVWAVELLQLGAYLVTVTGLFLHTGVGGVIPGPAAVREAADIVAAAWQQILTTIPPVPPTPEITFFSALAIGLIALVVDLLIAGSRIPAMVALPLLALYSVPASIVADLLPWFAFVCPAAAFAAMLAVDHATRTRATLRGVVHLATTAVVIAVLAIVGSLVITSQVTSVGTEGRIPHSGAPSGEIGLSPWARLRGDLTHRNPTDVLTVSGLSAPEYLRTFALETWTADEGFGFGPVHADASDIRGALPTNGASPSGASETALITPLHYRAKYLPVYLDAMAIEGISAGWDYDDRLRTAFRGGPVTPAPYRLTVDIVRADAATLRTENAVGDAALIATDVLPPYVTDLAARITANADNDFDAVSAILKYFTDPANGFTYSLTTPLGNSGSALVDFLTSRQGYCEQYAAAMAILARAAGIPARVGIGFTQGERQPNGDYLIQSTDAHAWVEVAFSESGWVVFDPTPAVGGQGGLQGFATSATPQATGSPSVAASTTPITAPTTTSPSRTGATGGAMSIADDPASLDNPAPTNISASAGRILTIAGLALAAVAALIGLLLIPLMVRRWRRRRRLSQAGTGDAAAAWSEILDTMRDHGLPMHAQDSARARANALARAARLSARDRDAVRVVVHAVEQVWYADGTCAQDLADQDLRAGVDAAIAGLRRSVSVPLLRRWWPRSLRRDAAQTTTRDE